MWIGAAIASVYILYGVLTSEAPVNYLFFNYLIWSVGVGLLARKLATTCSKSKDQVDYVDRLVKRGYRHAEAKSAWEIAVNGGSNLLLNLRQAESIADTARRTAK